MENPMNTQQTAQQAAAPVKTVAAKPAVTPAQRWLLLAVLLVGIAWRLGFADTDIFTWGGWYGAFWLCAMLAVTPFIWRQAVKSRTGIACGIAAVALCILHIMRGSRNGELTGYLALAIPAAMMLYLVFSAYDIPVQREGEAAKLALAGVFVYPFAGVPQFFRTIVSLFSGRVHGAWKRWLIGLAVGLPLAVAVTALLIRADSGMQRMFEALFTNLPFTAWLENALHVLGCAMLFFGVFERAIRREKPALAAAAPASWPASTMAIVIAPSLVIYAIFVILQFSYLFGGALPAELTYSEYARQGFTELNLVAAMNFTLFGLTQRYAKPHRLLTALCALLLAATASVVASCITRLLLYIGAYGLTILRILPLWLAIFLAALTVLCAVRLCKKNFPVLRMSGLAFLYWFVLLQIPDWNAVIHAYNAARGLL